MKLDLNCDMGESFGNYNIGRDEQLMPHLTSCNVACGFHGGDPYHIEKTIDNALLHNLRIGAHPSYPDLQGFGRRKMTVPPDELSSIIKYQVAAIKGLVESKGGKLSYVKPHGALYNSIAHNLDEAQVVLEAVRSIDTSLRVMVLAGAPIIELAQELGIKIIQEGFADRRYESGTKLMSRSNRGAVLHQPNECLAQVLLMAKEQKVQCTNGSNESIKVESVCIHGDNANAVDIAQVIHQALQENNLLHNLVE